MGWLWCHTYHTVIGNVSVEKKHGITNEQLRNFVGDTAWSKVWV